MKREEIIVWTVVGIILDNMGPTVSWIIADSAELAAENVAKEREIYNSSYTVVAVFKGQHKDELK
jgi:hypothetical protein